MSLENNISKIISREKEIENILVNSSNLKPSELANLSKRTFTELLGKYNVSIFNYPASDIANDVANA